MDGSSPENKIINISVEEKPTGEIAAGAGFGTDGASFMFSVSENNYLGKGVKVDNKLTINGESVREVFCSNPNINNSNNSGFASVEALETDRFQHLVTRQINMALVLERLLNFLTILNLVLVLQLL